MNVNNSKLLLFIPAILEHVSRNRTCSIGKLRTRNIKHVITPGSPSELDPIDRWSLYLRIITHVTYIVVQSTGPEILCSVVVHSVVT